MMININIYTVPNKKTNPKGFYNGQRGRKDWQLTVFISTNCKTL